MKLKILIPAVTYLLLSLYQTSSAQVSSPVTFNFIESFWGEGSMRLEPEVGETNVPLTIRIAPSSFEGNFRATGVRGTLTPDPLAFTTKDGTSQTVAVPGTYKVGDVIEFKFTINIKSDAKIGAYESELALEFYVVRDGTTVIGAPVKLKVATPLYGSPRLSLSLAPREIVRGSLQPVSLQVVNTGSGDAIGLEINVTSTELKIDAARRLSIQKLDSKTEQTLPIQLYAPSSTSASIASLTVITSYRTAYGNRWTTRTEIQVSLKPTVILLDVDATPKTLPRGSISEVTVKIRNKASVELRALRAELIPSTGSEILGSSMWIIDSLAPGETATFGIRIKPSADSASSRVTVVLRYQQTDGISGEQQTTIGFDLTQPALPPIQIRSNSRVATAGATSSQQVTLRNAGDTQLSEVQVSVTPQNGVRIVGSSNYWYFTKLDPGEETLLDIAIFVPEELSGAVSISLTTSWRDAAGTVRTVTHTIGYSIVPKVEASVIVQSPTSSFKAGDLNILPIILANHSPSALTDLQLRASVPAGVSIVGSDGRWQIEELDTGASHELNLMVYVGREVSVFNLELKLSWKDSHGSLRSDSRTLGFVASSKQSSPIELRAEPQELVAGRLTNVSITIRNTSPDTLRSMEVSVIPQSGFVLVGGDGNYRLGQLNANEQITFEMQVYSPRSTLGSGAVFRIEMSYQQGKLLRSEARNIDFSSRGFIELVLSGVGYTPGLLSPGRSVTLSGSIFNAGNAVARGLTAYTEVQSPLQGVSQDAASLIGDLAEGAEAPFSLTVSSPAGTQAGEYQVSLIIRYKDDLGEWRSLSRLFPLRVVEARPIEPSQRGGPQLPLSPQDFALGALVGGVAVFLILRRRVSRAKLL